ncbi:MAG: murein biosynthesis integral membrane protein MurJ [Gammaproteobacteria bacterium]|jgi:putative peptidoglycan lipid II flippase
MSRSLLRSTVVVGGTTLLSRILGFARDMVFARAFGAGLVMDAFFVAFKIPNFMRRLFGEGAFSQAFVPVIGEYRTRREHEEVRELADRVAGSFGGLLLLITVIGVLAAPLLVYLFAYGFTASQDKYDLTVAMLRVTFPYLFFISMTAFAGGILNTYDRFGVPAFTPVLLNIMLIGAALWAAPYFSQPGMALAWGVFFAGVVQLAFQLPFLARLRLLPRPRWGGLHEGVRRIMRLMLPALFGSSVTQVNLLLDTLIASFLATGSVSWLYYSDRLMEFPLGVFAIALGTVILPNLSRRHAAESREAFSNTLDWALRLVLLVGVPAAVGLFVLAGPMLTTLFQYGKFTARDTHMATFSLMAFALGLLGFTLVKVLAPGYFARQDTRTPMRIGIVAVLANIAFNLAITIPLAWSGFAAPHAGLALATSLAAFVNAGLLYRGLRGGGFYRPRPGWRPLAVRVLFANAVMGGVVWWGSGSLARWSAMHAGGRIFHLAGWITAGALVYLATLLLTGVRPRHFRGRSPEW